MGPLEITLIVLGVVLFLLISGGIFTVFYTSKIARKLYRLQWTRDSEAKFKRGCSDKGFDYHLDMFNKGMKYHDSKLANITEHEIKSMGLKLVAEYYDFGFDKAVIILPGRMETCYYGAFYAPAFEKAGYNVLSPDPRAHGLSEGDKITLGKYESIDAIEWAKYLHDKLGVKEVCLYGICGGATAACIASNNKDCPEYVNSFVLDGMFYSFFRVYKRHIKDEKKPVYPVIWEVMHYIKKYNDAEPYKAAPHKLIKNMHQRVLILSGSKDIFAISKEAKKMYDLCPSKDKHFALIENGRHSHLRYDNEEQYDSAIYNFLKMQ